MVKFGKWIAKHRIIILVISVLLLIPSGIFMATTRINYDILSYLPKDIETMKGQDILMEDFGKGGFSMVMVEGMTDKEVVETKKKIEAMCGMIRLPIYLFPRRFFLKIYMIFLIRRILL